MKTILTPKLFLVLCVTLFMASGLYSQGTPVSNQLDEGRAGPGEKRDGPRQNLFRELGLTRDQLQTIGQLNRDRKPVELAARLRFQEANRALNKAIYADAIDDSEFKSKLSEFQAAQAELARIKFANEMAIRKVLTPVQLSKFRELRKQFAEARKEMRDDQDPANDGPGFRPIKRKLRRPNN